MQAHTTGPTWRGSPWSFAEEFLHTTDPRVMARCLRTVPADVWPNLHGLLRSVLTAVDVSGVPELSTVPGLDRVRLAEVLKERNRRRETLYAALTKEHATRRAGAVRP